MNWTDAMRAAALAALAEQKRATTRLFDNATVRWMPQELWLKRARTPRNWITLPSLRDPGTPHRSGPLPKD